MKRGGWLKRYAELKAKTPLKRGGPIKPGPKKRTTAGLTGFTAATRAAAYEAFGGRCALCGRPLGTRWHAHHCQFRSQGGPHCLCNCAPLHDACHREVHDVMPRDLAEALRLVVRSGQPTAGVPVRTPDGDVLLPCDTGGHGPWTG